MPRVRREPLGRSRATRPSRKKIKKKQTVPSVERSPRSQAPAAVSASRGKSSSGKTQPPGQSAQAGQPAGEITHFFSKIQVAVVKMTKGNLAVGDKVRIQGKTTNFAQTIRSMQIESVDVRCARRGQLIGLKVERAAKAGDKLIRLR
ncbi:MAG: hypothetical protein HY210_09320 [Candidatus Omnitrophica bacterium]|nr:hypothetical protein [Candidatus Omnitrophota bacterium]